MYTGEDKIGPDTGVQNHYRAPHPSQEQAELQTTGHTKKEMLSSKSKGKRHENKKPGVVAAPGGSQEELESHWREKMHMVRKATVIYHLYSQ